MRKQFLKFFSVILIILISLNLFAGSALSVLLGVVAENYSENFSTDSDDLELIKIPVHYSSGDFQKINDHELMYHKKLYDIAWSFIKDGIQYFYCVNDFKEEKIVHDIQLCMASHLDYYNSSAHPGQVTHKLFTPENFYPSAFKKDLPEADFNFHFMIRKVPAIIWFEKTDPPPETSFC